MKTPEISYSPGPRIRRFAALSETAAASLSSALQTITSAAGASHARPFSTGSVSTVRSDDFRWKQRGP